MKKTFFFLILCVFISNIYQAQIYVLETQGQVSLNGKALKKGDEVSEKAILIFGKESKLNLLSPSGFININSNIPNINTTELGILIKNQELSKSTSTRSFSESENIPLEKELTNMMDILAGNGQSFEQNYGKYIEPYLKSRFDENAVKKAFDFLQNNFDKSPPTLTGLMSDEAQYQSIPQVSRLINRSYTSLPERFSLKEYCPKPGLQQYSDCVGWSTTYAARTILYAIRNNIQNRQTITAETFAPSFTYSQIKSSQTEAACKQGSYIQDAVKLIKDLGSIKNVDFEYSCSPVIENQDVRIASKFRIKNYKRLSGDYNSDRSQMMENIKKSLSEKRPVVIAMEVYDSFQRPSASATKGLWEGKKGKMVSRHAITVIGYDDTKYGGAFEIINSWGTFWGNEGFMWLKYKDFAAVTYEAYEMADYEASTPNNTKADLAGSFEVILDNGNSMPVRLNSSTTETVNYTATKSYSTGTQFRLSFTNNQPAYVYLLSYGTNTQKVSNIFPFDGYSALLDYSKNEIMIPNEDYWVQMDNNIGTDYLCILFSKEELDIKAIAKQMQRQSGSFDAKLKAALQNKMVENRSIKLIKDKISFDAKLNDKTVIPITLEIKHVN
jgi:C1A family cysteine protease